MSLPGQETIEPTLAGLGRRVRIHQLVPLTAEDRPGFPRSDGIGRLRHLIMPAEGSEPAEFGTRAGAPQLKPRTQQRLEIHRNDAFSPARRRAPRAGGNAVPHRPAQKRRAGTGRVACSDEPKASCSNLRSDRRNAMRNCGRCNSGHSCESGCLRSNCCGRRSTISCGKAPAYWSVSPNSCLSPASRVLSSFTIGCAPGSW